MLSDFAREELHKKFTIGKEIAAKRHAKQYDKEADSYERQGAKHAKAQYANIMDNISRSSAQESADSRFEKFSIPDSSRK